MEFIEFLKNRHFIIKGARKLKDISVQQYNSRLTNMIEKKIYNGENHLDEQIIYKISVEYANRANEYETTLKYYIEYKKHLLKQ